MEKKNSIKKEKDMTVNELANLMLKSFNSAQTHINERFDEVGKRFDTVDKKFVEVTKEINKINLNAVDVVRVEEFDKLKNRVTVLEHKR